MPWVPASSYHSCLSLHRQLAFAVWACISLAHPLKRVYRLPRIVGTGISHRLPPEVYHILLFWLSLFQEMVDSSQEASKSFSTSMEEESTFGLWGLLIFQHVFKIHPPERRKENLYQSIFLPIDPVVWRASSCSLRRMDHSVICGEVPNRGPVLPVFIPYCMEDAAATLLLLATNP